MFRIDDFAASIRSGLAAPSRYKVEFTFNRRMLQFTNLTTVNQLAFVCTQAELPGKKIDTSNDQTYGPMRKMAFGAIYDDLTLTFLCTNGMLEREVFDRWMSMIVDPSSNYMTYYDDYKSTINITTLQNTKVGQPTYNITVEEAFPISINQQQLSYENVNSVLTLVVTFAYRRWRTTEDVNKGNSYQWTRLDHLTRNSTNPNVQHNEWEPPENLDQQKENLYSVPLGSDPNTPEGSGNIDDVLNTDVTPNESPIEPEIPIGSTPTPQPPRIEVPPGQSTGPFPSPLPTPTPTPPSIDNDLPNRVFEPLDVGNGVPDKL